MPSALHPVEDRQRDLVARRELVGEALAGGVEQGRALAADRLGDQQPVEARSRAAPARWGGTGRARGRRARRRRRGPAPARRRSRPTGWSCAPRAPRRRRWRGRSPAPRSAPRVGDHAAAALAVAPQRDRRGPLEHLDPLVRGDQLGEALGDRAAGLGAAGVDDRGAASGRPRGRARGCRPGSRSKLDPAALELRDRRRRLARPAPRPPSAGRRRARPRSCPRRGARASRRSPSAAARPPCAQKLELSASGLRETSATREPRPRRPRARVEAGGARRRPPRRRARRASSARRHSCGEYGIGRCPGLYLRIRAPSSTTPAATPRTPGGCARSRRRCRSATGSASSWSRRRPPTASSSLRVHTRRAHRRDRGDLSARGGGMIDLDTVASAGSFEAALHAAGGGGRTPPSGCWPTGGFAFCGLRPPGPPRRARPRDGLLPVQQRRRRRRARARRAAAPSASWCSTGTSTTATAPRRSSTAPTRSSTRASTRARSIPGPAPPPTSAAARGRATRSTCRCRRAAGPTSSSRWSSTWSRRSPASGGPDLLAISAGYDAHRDDPLANCEVDDAAYGDMAATHARPRRRARRPGAGLPRGRLLARGAGAIGGRDAGRDLRRSIAARGSERRPRRPTASGWRASGRSWPRTRPSRSLMP